MKTPTREKNKVTFRSKNEEISDQHKFKVDGYVERGENKNECVVEIDETMHNYPEYKTNGEAERMDEKAGKAACRVNPMLSCENEQKFR